MPNVQAAQALSATLAAIFDVLNGACRPDDGHACGGGGGSGGRGKEQGA